MDWKKKLYLLGVVLLCTGVLASFASADNPSQQPMTKSQAMSNDAGAKVKVPGVVTPPVSRTAVMPPEKREFPVKAEEPTPEQLQAAAEEQKRLEETGGKVIPPDESLNVTSVVPVDLSTGPRDGEPRSACVGNKDIDGAGTTAFNYMFNAYWASRRVTSIYTASEFNCTGGPISGIRFYVSTLPTAGYPFVNFQIAMRHTTASTYTSPYCFTAFPDGWTVVYTSASQTITTLGWNTFTFTTPFVYNGTDNVEVDVSWGKIPSDSGNSGSIWGYTASPTPRTIYAYTDSVTALPPTWTCAVSGLYIYSSTVTPRCQFMFPPPTVGACCSGMSCTPDMTATACAAAGGVYVGDGTTCTPNPCSGACCVNYVCIGTMTQADCSAQSGSWYQSQDCATFYCPPWNDNCSAVTPVALTPGVPVTFNGTTLGATNDCAAFAGGQVWHAFTLPGTFPLWDVKLDYCTTSPAFGNGWLNMTTSCPCGTITAAGAYNSTECGDGNLTIRWGGLAPGNYWYPVLLDPAHSAAGPYTIHVVANPGYCASYATSTADETIKNFTLGTINNTTTNCDTYDNFTAISTNVQIGTTYPFSLTIGDCEGSSCYSKQAAIYVDWNQDYDFADTGELVWSSGQLGNTPCPDMTVTGNIAVPVGTPLGATRIRVVVIEGSALPPACGTYTWGATEDYTLVINPAPPTGACCFGVTCEDTGTWTEAACVAAGGRYAGNGSTCTPNPCFGACCLIDGSCIETMTATDCAAASGVFHGTGTACATTVCPTPGNDCTNPIVITLPGALPYTNTNYTCGRVDDYNATCMGLYDGGEDIIYKLVVTQDVCLSLVMSTTTTYTGMAIDDSCPFDATTCLYNVANSGAGGVSLSNVNLVAGTYWVMIDTWPAPACIPTFTLNITECPKGACCVGESCSIMYQAACAAAGGKFIGNGVPCDPNPCALRACCFWPAGTCQNLSEGDCATAGGTFHSDATCATITCPTPGDLCTDPVVITALPYANQFNNDTATAGPPSCNTYYTVTQNDWWFQYTPSANQCAFVDVYEVTSYDTVMGIYTGPDCNTLTNIVCVDDPDGYHIQLALNAGTTYWFQIGDYGSTEGGGVTNFALYLCPQGACCVGTTCTIEYSTACAALGGVYQGDNTTCDPNPCLIGACCNFPAPCADTDEPTCVAQGGTWHGGAHCATFVCPTPGDNCAAPFVVNIPAQVPFTDAGQHTCGRGNDYSDTCLGYYDGGEDIIYQLVVTAPTCVNITATGADSTQNWIGVGIDTACPLGATCMKVANSSSGTTATLANVSLPIGVYYVMVDTWPSPNCLTNFTLSITVGTGCPVGACCLYGIGTLGCEVMFQDDCVALGGAYGGNGSVCSGQDCIGFGIDNFCMILGGAPDCQPNGIPDICDINSGTSHDWDGNMVPDECQPDCNGNGWPDFCDLPGGCAIGSRSVPGCANDPDCGLSLDCQPDGIPDECQLGGGGGGGGGANLVQDPSFEGGTPSTAWGEFSTNFGTPLCDATSCGSGAGSALPHTGSWWCWFGGAGSTGVFPEVGSVTQTLTIPPGGATLEFYLWMGLANDPTSFVRALVDTTEVVKIWANDPLYAGGYALVTVDISAFAGGTHVLKIEGQQTVYGAGATNMNVDDVSVTAGGGGGGDCNNNGIPDDCDRRDHPTDPIGADCNGNLVIDTCEWADCNNNGVLDACDILSGYSVDCNGNGIPDECDVASGGASSDCNANGVPDECDIASGASADCNGNGIPDECDIATCPPGDLSCADCQGDGIPDGCQLGIGRDELLYDDGSSEDGLGNGYYAHEVIWIHHFTVATPGTVTAIKTTFGTPAYPGSSGVTAGDTFHVYVWSDPNGDGSPADGVCLVAVAAAVDGGSIDSDVFQTVAIPPTTVGLSFFIGAGYNGGTGFAAPLDETAPLAHESWAAYTISPPVDPNNFGSTLLNMDTVVAGDWMLRAIATFGPPANDCNQNSIPDECDISVAFNPPPPAQPIYFCQGDVYPPCDTDYNGDGIPDHCQTCGDFCSTAYPPYGAPDGLVNENDYWYIHDGIGFSAPHPKYVEHELADMDGDGAITLQDYQSWVMCYHMANGKVFVPPTKRPAPPKQPKPLPTPGLPAPTPTLPASGTPLHTAPAGSGLVH